MPPVSLKILLASALLLVLGTWVSGFYGGDAGEVLAGAASAPMRFTEVASEVGLDYSGASFSLAAADYNRDGWVDIAFSRHRSVVLHTNEGGHFSTRELARGDNHGLSWFDWNGDSWPELYVSTGGNRGRGNGPSNILFVNKQGAINKPGYIGPLANAGGRGRESVPWDVNGDGALDVFMVNFSTASRLAIYGHSTGEPVPGPPAEVLPSLQASNLRAMSLGDAGEPLLAGSHGSRAYFYRWKGKTLVDVSDHLDLAPTGGRLADLVAGDVDNDGDIDLLQVRTPWVGEGVRRVGDSVLFRFARKLDQLDDSLAIKASGRVAVDLWADNRPGADFYLGNGEQVGGAGRVLDLSDPALSLRPGVLEKQTGPVMWCEAGTLRLRFNAPSRPNAVLSGRLRFLDEPETIEVEGGVARPMEGLASRLLLWEEGRLVDRTAQSGLDVPGYGEAALMADFDNDGDLDIFLVNGSDLFGNPADQLFINDGRGQFSPAGPEAGVAGPSTGRGNAALALDYDNDGDLDLVVANGAGGAPGNDGPVTVLRNDSEGLGNWLKVWLLPVGRNTMALGARVSVTTEAGRQVRFVGAGTEVAAHSWQPLHFGLGDAATGTVEVQWPSGRVSRQPVTANRTVEIREPATGSQADLSGQRAQ